VNSKLRVFSSLIWTRPKTTPVMGWRSRMSFVTRNKYIYIETTTRFNFGATRAQSGQERRPYVKRAAGDVRSTESENHRVVRQKCATITIRRTLKTERTKRILTGTLRGASTSNPRYVSRSTAYAVDKKTFGTYNP